MSILANLQEARSRKKALARVQRVRKVSSSRRAEHAVQKKELESRVADVWGQALTLLEDLILEARSLGVRVATRTSPQVSLDMRHVQHALYARALLTASEILTLLKTGHGHGAYARWRTLFELSAISEFVKIHGDEAAVRYRQHYGPETRRYLLARWPDLENNASNVPKSARELFEKLTVEMGELKAKFGAKFTEDLGWAEPWLPSRRRLSVADIVNAVELGSARAEYKEASYYVHATGRGSLDHFRATKDGAELLSTPNDDLISRPGRLCSISLPHVASTFVQACRVSQTEDRVWALGIIAEDARHAFESSHRRWTEETGQEELVWQE